MGGSVAKKLATTSFAGLSSQAYETVFGGGEAYFEGSVMLLFFLLAGRVLDAMMRDRARAGIEALPASGPRPTPVATAEVVSQERAG